MCWDLNDPAGGLQLKPSVFVALGSNLGDAAHNVLRAFARLHQLSAGPFLQSSLWQTTPVECPPGSPLFVNAAAALTPHPQETPESLLAHLLQIEKEFGRQSKTFANEPRPLDLDLIAFENQTRSANELMLPHPRAHLRRFVLQPLAELAPDLILPCQTASVAELLGLLPPDPSIRRLA